MVMTVVTVVEDEDEEARMILRTVMSLTWKIIFWSAGYFKFCFMMIMLVVFSKDNKMIYRSNKVTGSIHTYRDHMGIVGLIVVGISCYLFMYVAFIMIIFLDLVKKLKSFLMIKDYYNHQQEEEGSSTSTTTTLQVTQLEDIGGPLIYLPIMSFFFLGIFCWFLTLTRPPVDGQQNPQPGAGMGTFSTDGIRAAMLVFAFFMLSGHIGCFFYQIYRDLKLFAQRRYERATALELQERPIHHQTRDERISPLEVWDAGAYGRNINTTGAVSSSLSPSESCRCSANEWRWIKEEDIKFSNDYRHWEIERMKLGQMIHDAISTK